jgi:phosphatidylserine/phosphatidylglycerophosphate/cardiolipin synthase-like enzyme
MGMRKGLLGVLAVVGVSLLTVAPARADRLCDPAAEDCREGLLNLIRAEQTGIDVAFWFMEDTRYSTELIRRAQAGVPVRVIVDTSANAGHPINAQIIEQLRTAGIPLRRRSVSSILHWKMMLFAGQGQVEFSGANYSPDAFVPTDPYRNYVDEAVFFTADPALVHSFMQRFDDLWTDTTSYANYANITGALKRRYPSYPIAPELNFPPSVSYRTRAVSGYQAEKSGIDAIMYRITDRAHTDALIAAVQRGVRVRVITEQAEYRNPARLWDAWNVDRLWMAGIEVRQRAHAGLNHQKSVILRGQNMAIFGSSNWTTPSDQSQEEHNLFTTRPWIVQWFEAQFDRKWNNTGPAAETQQFQPQPPGEPIYGAPANGAAGVATIPVLTFNAGPFAHLYDIYVGTTSPPPLIAVDVPLGPSENGAVLSYQVPALAPGTKYYWRVVAKTMALQPTAGSVWSFTTAGAPGPAPAPLPSPQPTPTPDPGPAPAPAPAPSPDPDPAPQPEPSPAPGPSPVPAPAPAPLPTPRPAMSIDLPGDGSAVRQPFVIAGWALDLAGSDNGIDMVHVYAYPATGAPPIFLGVASVSGARPDVGAYFGARFTSSGYGLVVRGLAPGSYMIAVFAHSSYGAGFPLTKVVNVRVEPSAMVVIDTPRSGATVSGAFLVGGWAADFGAATGGGIDIVHVYAYPLNTAGAPIFLGQADVKVSRPDVAAYGGAQFGSAGYDLLAPPLPAGRYLVVAYGRSLVTGTFSVATTAEVLVR